MSGKTYDGRIPVAAWAALENSAAQNRGRETITEALKTEARGISHGKAGITVCAGRETAGIVLHIRDGKPARYEIRRAGFISQSEDAGNAFSVWSAESFFV